ncbi:CPBP family intramembrane glutamic endopeptidase [Leucobacter sp. 1207-22]|uniref:CPBP family intramembrane glutamic endopeptidase n=1 Tax=Leucobacter sp. 1207-22 TaxID=2604456 RepID=UPI004062DABF
MTSSTPQNNPDPAAQPEPTPQPAPGAAVPQSWAWAKPAQVMVPRVVETEPLEYHRLYRGAAKYQWWKPLVLVLLAGAFYIAFSLLLSLVLMPLIMAFDPEFLMQTASGESVLDTQRPLSVLYSLLAISSMLPAVILAMLCMGIRPTGRVWSVAGRIRWGLLGRTTLFAIAGVATMNIVGIAATYALDPSSFAVTSDDVLPDFSLNAALLSGIFILLLVPIQATAEEVVFRGVGMQVFGSWVKSPWLAVLVPSVLFAMAHIYDIWGMLAVGLMGLVAAWLAWRTGGLEAAIAIHVINNLVAFGFMASGTSGETAQVAEGGSLGSIIGEVAGLGLFAWLVIRSFKKHGYGRERIDLVVREVPVTDAAVAYAAPAAPEAPGAPDAPTSTDSDSLKDTPNA